MCGIAGIIDAASQPETRSAAVARMCDAMRHRGPDDGGLATIGAATIGMRRLAIFDPAHGHQPMQSPDGRWTLIFNGAIYNFRALRSELAGSGWSFKTECDTEVLLAAFSRWGEKCLERLRGMFAFAVWDAREESLFLARDPFGIKPLYFQHRGGRLLFASELRALQAAERGGREVDPAAVADYLGWLAVPAPSTLYRGVVSLRPGECAVFREGKLAVRRAWSFRQPARKEKPCRSREEFTQELRARLEDTIRAHMAADVPVGAFLSGGLDSTAVVGLMTRASNAQLRTFSIVFDEPGYSEASEAEESARHFGTAHHAKVLAGKTVAADIERLLAALDQPTGDAINTYYASQAARAGGVTVALSGLGGDELFGGYPAFSHTRTLARALPFWRLAPPPARRMLLRRLARGDTRQRKLGDALGHATTLHELCALQRRVFSDDARAELLAPEARAAAGTFHPELEALRADLPQAEAFEAVSAWELRTYMADVLLRDSDTMSMAHSLELRVPFVDRPLIEWLRAQPTAFKHTPAQPKHALFAAVRDIVPASLADRRKRGFTLPFAVWMKRDLRPFLEETFSDATIDRSGLFERATVQRLWRGFLAGDDTREWPRVWSLAVLLAFLRRSA